MVLGEIRLNEDFNVFKKDMVMNIYIIVVIYINYYVNFNVIVNIWLFN